MQGKIIGGYTMNPTKLKRLAPGHYVIEGTSYHIFQSKGRSWGGRTGSYAWTEWTMLRRTEDGFEKGPDGIHRREILESSTIEGLRKKIVRYFTPYVSQS